MLLLAKAASKAFILCLITPLGVFVNEIVRAVLANQFLDLETRLICSSKNATAIITSPGQNILK